VGAAGHLTIGAGARVAAKSGVPNDVPPGATVGSGMPAVDIQRYRRVIAAWQLGAQDQLIATAQVVGDRLLVVSCALEVFEIPFALIPALRRIPVEQRAAFTLSSEGSYLHWPHSDIHLDLDALRYATDPQQHTRQQALRLAADKRFGAAVTRVRKQRGLRQSDIAGLSERQVRRIEKGQRTTVAALELLAQSHGLALNEYLHAVADAMSFSAPAPSASSR